MSVRKRCAGFFSFLQSLSYSLVSGSVLHSNSSPKISFRVGTMMITIPRSRGRYPHIYINASCVDLKATSYSKCLHPYPTASFFVLPLRLYGPPVARVPVFSCLWLVYPVRLKTYISDKRESPLAAATEGAL